MFYGFKIGDYHTANDLNLRCFKIEISTPKRKSNYIDVPYADGKLDLSLNVPACYTNRAIKLHFESQDKNDDEWLISTSRLLNLYQGKTFEIYPDTYKGQKYYKGEIDIEQEKESYHGSTVIFNIDAEPYLYNQELISKTVESGTANINIEGLDTPLILTASQPCKITLGDTIYSYQACNNLETGITLKTGDNQLLIQSTSSVTLEHRERSL